MLLWRVQIGYLTVIGIDKLPGIYDDLSGDIEKSGRREQ